MAEFEGQTAIVTGSAQGIGRAIAAELLRQGANVALCDLKVEKLEAFAREMAGVAKGSIYYGRVDLSKGEEIRAFVAAVEDKFSKVDILVNNAGIHPLHMIEDIEDEEWDLVLSINLKAQYIFCQSVLPGMRRRKYGRIINISSEAGKNGGTVAAPHYCASKGGVLAFTRNLAQQVGADGITVNAICPGRIATEMSGSVSPAENQKFIDKSIIKRLGTPEDIGFAVTYLASKRAGFVTAETMNVNGGTLRD
ncbi:MAG: SDR family NAD(P)-dependent oxidoreductase [Rectinemataceae bacterium]|jgi:3-oxoacyl-[acyl-carrier protein] reductase